MAQSVIVSKARMACLRTCLCRPVSPLTGLSMRTVVWFPPPSPPPRSRPPLFLLLHSSCPQIIFHRCLANGHPVGRLRLREPSLWWSQTSLMVVEDLFSRPRRSSLINRVSMRSSRRSRGWVTLFRVIRVSRDGRWMIGRLRRMVRSAFSSVSSHAGWQVSELIRKTLWGRHRKVVSMVLDLPVVRLCCGVLHAPFEGSMAFPTFMVSKRSVFVQVI